MFQYCVTVVCFSDAKSILTCNAPYYFVQYDDSSNWKIGYDLGGRVTGTESDIVDGSDVRWKTSPKTERRTSSGYREDRSENAEIDNDISRLDEDQRTHPSTLSSNFRLFESQAATVEEGINRIEERHILPVDQVAANVDAWKIAYRSTNSKPVEYAESAVSAVEINNPNRQIRELERIKPSDDFKFRNSSGLLDRKKEYVEPAGSVVEANDPNRAIRDLQRIDYRKDFKTLGKGGIKPIAPVIHEPYIDSATLSKMTDPRGGHASKAHVSDNGDERPKLKSSTISQHKNLPRAPKHASSSSSIATDRLVASRTDAANRARTEVAAKKNRKISAVSLKRFCQLKQQSEQVLTTSLAYTLMPLYYFDECLCCIF